MATTRPIERRRRPRDPFDGTGLALRHGLDLAAGLAIEDLSVTKENPVVGYGATKPYTPNNSLLAEIHAPAEIGVILVGATERYFQGWHFAATPGDVWMHGMWEPHGWKVLVPNTGRVVVDFLPEFLGEETLGGGARWWSLFAARPSERPRVAPEDRPRALALAWELHEEIESEAPDWQIAARLLVLQLLLLVSRGWTPPTHSERARPRNDTGLGRLLPALNLVRSSGGNGVPLAMAAAACDLRRSQFSEEFRRTLGVTYGQFRLRVRLTAAAHEFLTTDLAVSAVATRVGFSDASHLNRAFVRQYSCTPGVYRSQRG